MLLKEGTPNPQGMNVHQAVDDGHKVVVMQLESCEIDPDGRGIKLGAAARIFDRPAPPGVNASCCRAGIATLVTELADAIEEVPGTSFIEALSTAVAVGASVRGHKVSVVADREPDPTMRRVARWRAWLKAYGFEVALGSIVGASLAVLVHTAIRAIES